MLTKAILVEENQIPSLRAVLCHKLNAKGHTQSEISLILKITQPMVSKYLSEKSSEKSLSGLSDKIILFTEKSKSLGFSFAITQNQISNSEYFLSTKEHILTDEKSETVNDIDNAIKILIGKDLSEIACNVKMNIARAVINAETKEDIASIPGGLVLSDGKIIMHHEPEFGASRHLSELLMGIKKINPEIYAIMNIKFSQNVLNKIIRARLKYHYLHEKYALHTRQKEFDAVIHKGSFGIEPCCYLVGKTAEEVSKKCLRLI